MRSLKSFTFFAILLFPAVFAHPLDSFSDCLPSGIPFFLPGQIRFQELVSASFRNNRGIPSAVVRPRNEAEVAVAVRCAHKAGLRVCARSGGHSLAGKSLCNDLLVDVGLLRSITVGKNKIAKIGGGATMGEVLWALWHNGNRWFASGVCPGVGVGGYVFGGGHGPYEGRLGMACDALESVRIVNRFGRVREASRKKHKNLFWGLCGAGGGQLGIVTSFKIWTASSKPFDNAVVFRFRWDQKRIGELMHKWMDYDEENGDVWFRMEMGLKAGDEKGMHAYGACYNIGTVDQCMDKLKKADFFNTPSRETLIIFKVKNALDTHAFFGPDGMYARRGATNLTNAMLTKRYVDMGKANPRIYQSTFITKSNGTDRISVDFWQRYGDFCAKPGAMSIPYVVCELNLFNNAIDKPRNNAFAHRNADVITHYIVGGGTEKDKLFVYEWMKNHFKPFTTGVYVNYPELELTDSEYPKLYWGANLDRLKRLKKHHDPDLFFVNPQPIPRT